MARTGRTPPAVPSPAPSAAKPQRSVAFPGQPEGPVRLPPSRAAALLLGITYWEERLRDGALGLVLHLIPPGVTPDHLTLLRVALASAGALMWAAGAPLRPVLWVLALAAFTDFVDGPLARRRGGGEGLGARLDQLADAMLAGTLGIMALAEGLLDGCLVAAMVLAQLMSLLAGMARCAGWVDRPTTLARLQFVLVVSGFWTVLLGASMRHAPLVAVGRGLLYGDAGVALLLATLRFAGWYPRRPI